MARNYQEQYGNIYAKPSDMFAPANADEIPSLLPSTNMTDMQLVLSGKLPASAMFQKAPTGNSTLDALSPSDPAFSFGFDTTQYLIKNDYRLEYLADAQKMSIGQCLIYKVIPTITQCLLHCLNIPCVKR